jgi:hypothetical protein
MFLREVDFHGTIQRYIQEYKTLYVSVDTGDPALVVEGKPIPVTGRKGSYSCETSRLPYLLENQLTHGGETASLGGFESASELYRSIERSPPVIEASANFSG